MSNEPPQRHALATAEEVLRTIYGDDFAGCTVSLEKIAAVIGRGFQQGQGEGSDVLELYEKVVEALHLLSTPPDKEKVTDHSELRTLLTERLDAIHAITAKTIQTTELVKAQRNKSGGAGGPVEGN